MTEPVEVQPANIPDELKERDQWLLWDRSNDTPRQPHWNGDFAISWSDPDDWHSFDEAVELAQSVDSWGIGYVMAADNDDHARGIYGVIDLDGCAKGEYGSPKEWVPSLDVFAKNDAYIEWSPSGTGLHIPIAGVDQPDWFTDQHFTDDEHEGVELLTHKFCTFTGNELRSSGEDVVEMGDWLADWLREAYKSVSGDDPLERDRRSADPDTSGGRSEDFDDETVEEMLDHIDADCSYSQWRDIGFALHDHFGGSQTGKRLFEDWSRDGSKWDDQAADYLDRIWDDATAGGGRTIGTVVYLAKQNGWEPTDSARPKHRRQTGESEASEDGESADGDSGWDIDWDYVREMYAEEGSGWGRQSAADLLDDRYSWMYVVESETLWVYDEDRGYYNRWGEEFVANVLEEHLGTYYSRSERDEILGRLQARHQTHREELNARARGGYYLCVGNGVVDLETGERYDHDPSFKFTRGLEWDYEPAQADPEPVIEFLDDITKREADRDTLLDHLAHGLMPGHPFRAFLILYGPGSNGKTQMGKLFRGFVGEDNAASVELQDLTGDDQFATGGLPGAFVNVGDDISVSEIRDVSILKSLTGGGTVRANEKYEKQYEFENEAAMFFSANEPPRISEEKDAIGDRLYPIEMPYRFLDEDQYDPDDPKHKKKKPGIAKSLLNNDAAMRGLLLLAVKHAQELLDSDGQYSMPEGPEQRRELYEAASDPIRQFALEYLEQADQGDLILKDDAFDVYKAMCEEQDERVASSDGFKRQIAQQALIDVESTRTRKLTPGDSQERCWRYVQFGDGAKDLMSPRLVERYFPEDESGDDDTDGDGESGDSESEDTVQEPRSSFGATPISGAADSLTGYVTVTAEIAAVQRLGEEGNGVKAILKDSSGAMDLKTWDDDWSARLEELEGECVAVENAEVYEDDYDDTRKIAPVEGLTDVQTIQQGVGYTEGEHVDDDQAALDDAPDADDGDQEADAAADGGRAKTDDDDGDLESLKPQVVQTVRDLQEDQPGGAEREDVVDAFADTEADADAVRSAIESALEDGRLTEAGGGMLRKI